MARKSPTHKTGPSPAPARPARRKRDAAEAGSRGRFQAEADPLDLAAAARDWPRLRELVRGRGVLVYNHLLVQAAEQGDRELLHALAEAGADVRLAGSLDTGDNLLMIAARNGRLEVVQDLLAAGVDVHYVHPEDDGATALSCAASAGHGAVVRYLLAAGARVENFPGHGDLALRAAVECGHQEVAAALIAAGAEVNEAILECAADAGEEAMVAYLASLKKPDKPRQVTRRLREGARRQQRRQDKAAQNLILNAGLGKVRAVEKALAAGVDVNTANEDGMTALHAAACWGHVPVLRALLAAGADPNVREGNTRETPLQAAAGRGHFEAARLLLAAGADVNLVDAERKTALHHAAEHHPNPEMIKLLLAAGADPKGKAPAAWVSTAWGNLLRRLAQVFRLNQATLGKRRKAGGEDRAYLPACMAAMQEGDKQVRRLACELLGRLGPVAAEAVPALTAALQDPAPGVRKAAATALGQIRSP